MKNIKEIFLKIPSGKFSSISKLLLLIFICFCKSTVKAQSGFTRLDSIVISAKNGTYPNLDGIVISQHGKIVFESYFNGFSKDSLHDTRSAFKSVTGLLTGIAVDKGFIKNLDQKVYDFFPDYKKPKLWDQRKEELTIKHLLTMKSGFDCEEWNGMKDCEEEMERSGDWMTFCLNLDLKNKPGSTWDYTSVNTMLLGGIIASSSHMTVSDFAERYLYHLLDIKKYRWTKDSVGHELTSGNFYMLPADMIKIGEIILNNGVYNGKRIVSAEWIKRITERNTLIENFSNVKISKNKSAIPQPAYYGYTWYNEQVKTEKLNYNIIFASGNGGQYIMIVKDLDLVVVFTGNSYNSSKSKLAFDIMIKYVLPGFKP